MTHEKTDISIEPATKTGANKPPVWFVFSGMGSQWSGMGRDLMQFEVFENSIKKSALCLSQHGIDLYDIIMNANDETFDNVLNSFVSIAAVQVNIAKLDLYILF